MTGVFRETRGKSSRRSSEERTYPPGIAGFSWGDVEGVVGLSFVASVIGA
jgi:hypothetical protein